MGKIALFILYNGVRAAVKKFGKTAVDKVKNNSNYTQKLKDSKKFLRRTFGDPSKTAQYFDNSTGKFVKNLPKANYRGAGGRRFKVDEKGKIITK